MDISYQSRNLKFQWRSTAESEKEPCITKRSLWFKRKNEGSKRSGTRSSFETKIFLDDLIKNGFLMVNIFLDKNIAKTKIILGEKLTIIAACLAAKKGLNWWFLVQNSYHTRTWKRTFLGIRLFKIENWFYSRPYTGTFLKG